MKEEIKISSEEDQSHISVTSGNSQKITETIDIKTTEYKIVNDLEKESKYQFTMSVPDKETYKNTLNSITKFLETEQNFSDQQLFNRSTGSQDTEVTSSDETDGSQTKSEGDSKSDKSFMGKMSKKLLGVFKKEDKEKLGKKSHQNKKHKKGKTHQTEILDEDSKQTVKDTNKQVITEKNKLNTSENVDSLISNSTPDQTSNEESGVAVETKLVSMEIAINEDSKTTLPTAQISHDNNVQVNKNQEPNLHQYSIGDEKQRLNEINISDSSKLLEVSINEKEKENSSDTIEENITGTKENNFKEINPVTQESAKENNTDITNDECSKNLKQGKLLDVKALSNSMEHNYLQNNDKVTDITKSKYESTTQITVSVTDNGIENLTDISNISVEQAKSSKDKSKSFFGGIFSKIKEDEKTNDASNISVSSSNEKTETVNKYDLNEITNDKVDSSKQNSALKDTEVKMVHQYSTLQPSAANELQDTTAIASSDKTLEIGDKIKMNSSTKSDKKPKEKSKSFFGSIFGKGNDEILDSEKRTMGDTTFFIPKTTEFDEIKKVIKDETSEIVNENVVVSEDTNVMLVKEKLNVVVGEVDSIKNQAEDHLALTAKNITDANDEVVDSNKTTILAALDASKEEVELLISKTSNELPLTNNDSEKEASSLELEVVQNIKEKYLSPKDHIGHSSSEVLFDDKTKISDPFDPYVSQAIDKNKTPINFVQDEKVKLGKLVPEKAEDANFAPIPDNNVIKAIHTATLPSEMSETMIQIGEYKDSEETSTYLRLDEKEVGPGVNAGIAKDIKDKATKMAINFNDQVGILKGKDLDNIGDTMTNDKDKLSKDIIKTKSSMPIDGSNKTAHILDSGKPTTFEVNAAIPSDFLDISNEAKKIASVEDQIRKIGTSTDVVSKEVNDTLSLTGEVSKGTKEKCVTFSENIIEQVENISDSIPSKIAENSKYVDETVKDIGVNKDANKTPKDLLSHNLTSTSKILKEADGESKKKIAPALEIIAKLSKGIVDTGKVATNNIDSSIADPAEAMDKSDKPYITPNIINHGKEKEESLIKSAIVERSNEMQSKDNNPEDSSKNKSDIKSVIENSLTEIQDSLNSSLQSSKECLQIGSAGFEKSIALNDSFLDIDKIKSEMVEKEEDEIITGNVSNISGRDDKELTSIVLSEYPGLEMCHSKNDYDNVVINKEPDHNLEKMKPTEELPASTSTNDDKLNNILIDMLIEQECLQSPLTDISTRLSVDTNPSELKGSTTLPEKHDTEESEKPSKNVSPPFKTVASFGEVESLINEEELKRSSVSNSAGHSSYVTTPTMQRRRIGGSQRLSREERPDLREVSHMEDYYSSDEDEINYIVTEPSERSSLRTVTFQVESEDESYLKESDSSSELEIEVTEMTPSPDPTSKKQAQITVEEGSEPQSNQTKSRLTSNINTQRVERRFERMASETLEADPTVNFTADREFQRMVSQMSNEEVDACLSQWDEGGLTPSEELDSTKDTVEGDIDPELEALPEGIVFSLVFKTINL